MSVFSSYNDLPWLALIPVLASILDALIVTNPDKLWSRILSAVAFNVGHAKNDRSVNR